MRSFPSFNVFGQNALLLGALKRPRRHRPKRQRTGAIPSGSDRSPDRCVSWATSNIPWKTRMRGHAMRRT